ncbi:hypothetical protein [Pseudactinotalea sp. Z1732]|uniref:hypothetical protein n=1 Tax=Micrococcales TaxID=85006 RepID=UPI003C79C451
MRRLSSDRWGGGSLAEVDGAEVTGSVTVTNGPTSLLDNGTGRFVERDEAAGRIVITARRTSHLSARAHADTPGAAPPALR